MAGYATQADLRAGKLLAGTGWVKVDYIGRRLKPDCIVRVEMRDGSRYVGRACHFDWKGRQAVRYSKMVTLE